ncbi:unnamed protein product [Calypogeia fissa]
MTFWLEYLAARYKVKIKVVELTAARGWIEFSYVVSFNGTECLLASKISVKSIKRNNIQRGQASLRLTWSPSGREVGEAKELVRPEVNTRTGKQKPI